MSPGVRIAPEQRLRRAIYLSSLSLVQRVLTSNAHLPELIRNPDYTDRGNTSLHLAAKLGLPDIAVRPTTYAQRGELIFLGIPDRQWS